VSKPNRYEIRIAGFGGQGVVTIGKILGIAFSVHDRKYSVNTQSYGPESRGGACRSEVVVSDGEINCVEICPQNAIRACDKINSRGHHLPIEDDMQRCSGCKLCEIVCPDFAIAIETG
jgi:NAD-dependent dihydropyrimidine dehydrogenase PreA subunit